MSLETVQELNVIEDGGWKMWDVFASIFASTEPIAAASSPGCTPVPRSPDSSLMLGRPGLSSGITLSELSGCASGGIRRFETGLLG